MRQRDAPMAPPAKRPSMTMAELTAQQQGSSAGASLFRLTNGAPILLLANGATTNTPAGAPPPAVTALPPTVCLPSAKLFFSIFIFYAWFGVLLKGMGESFLLSKDEPLTSDIDGVMAL